MPCQIWLKSVKTRPSYGDFTIFQDGGRRHLGFFKFQTFNGRTAQEGRSASPCQIWSKSVKTRRRYSDFSIFQDGGRRHLGFYFSNFKFLTVARLRNAELRRHAKFGRNRSKCGRVIAIFRFFKMAATAILDFQISNFSRSRGSEMLNCVALPNLVKIGQNAAEI